MKSEVGAIINRSVTFVRPYRTGHTLSEAGVILPCFLSVHRSLQDMPKIILTDCQVTCFMHPYAQCDFNVLSPLRIGCLLPLLPGTKPSVIICLFIQMTETLAKAKVSQFPGHNAVHKSAFSYILVPATCIIFHLPGLPYF